MDALSLAGFALVFLAAVASPGPAVAATLARVMARGPGFGTLCFCAGLILGDVTWLVAAALGLAALAAAFAPLLVVIKYAGAAYLGWLAWRLWTAPAGHTDAPPPKGEGVRALFGGLALQLGNPKTILFYVALLPTFVDVRTLTPLTIAALAAIIVVVSILVLAAYVTLAARVRAAFRSPRAQRIVNRVSGAAMGAAAAAIVAR